MVKQKLRVNLHLNEVLLVLQQFSFLGRQCWKTNFLFAFVIISLFFLSSLPLLFHRFLLIIGPLVVFYPLSPYRWPHPFAQPHHRHSHLSMKSSSCSLSSALPHHFGSITFRPPTIFDLCSYSLNPVLRFCPALS